MPEYLITAPAEPLPDWAARLVNLADPRIGAGIVACSDDFFAPAARMLAPAPPVFIPGKYDDNGKWMDGWESRRRRDGGHDWCVVALGRPGSIAGIDIDTSFFTGNYPPGASLDGCPAGADPAAVESWRPLLPQTPLAGNSHHWLVLPEAHDAQPCSHVRLNIFPDGGVARLRVYGRVAAQAAERASDGLVDLVALVNGGRALAWNDAHFGAAANLLLPGRGIDMGDGWETRRRREPGHDWCVLALGQPGRVVRVEVDTAHFKGNYPDRASLQAAWLPRADEATLAAQSGAWPLLLPEQRMAADSIQQFGIASAAPVTHVRLNLFPDGGVSRLRLWGVPEAAAP